MTQEINGNDIIIGTIPDSALTNTPVGGATTIASIDNLSNALSSQILNPVSSWDSNMAYLVETYTTVIPITSHPVLAYFTDWDYILEISPQDTNDFTTPQVVNFGKNRGTTQNVTIPNTNISGDTIWYARAYFRIEKYETPGTYFKTPYKLTGFTLANTII